MGYKGRDVEVVPLDDKRCLVTACDSLGAIGSKELDVVKVTNYIVGRFTTRVALLEVLSTGAVPKVITAAIANEPSPTGDEIIEGINDELKAADSVNIPLAISTEKNFPTKQTGLGITVVGVCENKNLRIATSQSGDLVYSLGKPKVGQEVNRWDDPEIIQAKHVNKLLKTSGVHDIVIVGSQGIRKESELLATNVNTTLVLENSISVDIDKSGGPGTCLIFTLSPEKEKSLPDFNKTPISKIGVIK